LLSRDNIKYCIFVSFITILIYKAIDSPYTFISGINGMIKFLSPFLLAVLMCLLINPLIMCLEKNLKLPRLFNIFISYIFLFLFLGFGLNLLIPSILDTLNTIISEIPNYINNIDLFISKYMSILDTLIPHLQRNLDSILKKLVDMLSKISSDLLIYIFSITSLFFNIIMGMILSIYILYDKERILISLKNLLYASVSKKRATDVIEFFNIVNEIFYHYIIGKFIDSVIIGIITFVGFRFFINIKSSLFLSFIIFLTNMIPYFGPFIGAVFPILMTLVYSPMKALWVAIFIFILQQIDGNLIGPKVMGDYVGLNPLWIVSSVLIGGSLFGLVGVFLSVPIAAIIKVYLDKYIDRNLNIKNSK
jgi:predicted PurR-regulated permease PerM